MTMLRKFLERNSAGSGRATWRALKKRSLFRKSKLDQDAQKDKTATVPIQEIIEFADFKLARIHLIYWATLLFIYTNTQTICNPMSKSTKQGQKEHLGTSNLETIDIKHHLLGNPVYQATSPKRPIIDSKL